jgi:hypothetical protein
MRNKKVITRCECRDGCQCQEKPGPAAYLIQRDGRKLRVCTRCTLPGDETLEVLVNKNTPSREYIEHDALGILCLVFRMREIN